MNFQGDWSYKDNKRLYITGGIALGSMLVYAGIWLSQKFKSNKLSPWLEEYISDLRDQYKEFKNTKNIPVSFIASCMNLSNEVQSYLFNKDHQELEDERTKNIKNEKIYEELVAETVEIHEGYYHTAANIIKSKVY
jgi:hypothetical protein